VLFCSLCSIQTYVFEQNPINISLHTQPNLMKLAKSTHAQNIHQRGLIKLLSFMVWEIKVQTHSSYLRMRSTVNHRKSFFLIYLVLIIAWPSNNNYFLNQSRIPNPRQMLISHCQAIITSTHAQTTCPQPICKMRPWLVNNLMVNLEAVEPKHGWHVSIIGLISLVSGEGYYARYHSHLTVFINVRDQWPNPAVRSHDMTGF
jgi:hypothetical protein